MRIPSLYTETTQLALSGSYIYVPSMVLVDYHCYIQHAQSLTWCSCVHTHVYDNAVQVTNVMHGNVTKIHGNILW